VADDPRLQELLDEISDSGRMPEEVCGACPELLPEVRRLWLEMRIVEAQLDALFPMPAPAPDAETPVPWPADAELPRIPGYEVEILLGRGGMGVVYRARTCGSTVSSPSRCSWPGPTPHGRSASASRARRSWWPG